MELLPAGTRGYWSQIELLFTVRSLVSELPFTKFKKNSGSLDLSGSVALFTSISIEFLTVRFWRDFLSIFQQTVYIATYFLVGDDHTFQHCEHNWFRKRQISDSCFSLLNVPLPTFTHIKSTKIQMFWFLRCKYIWCPKSLLTRYKHHIDFTPITESNQTCCNFVHTTANSGTNLQIMAAISLVLTQDVGSYMGVKTSSRTPRE